MVKVIFDLDNSLIKIEDSNNYSSGYSFSGNLHVSINIVGQGGTVHLGGSSSSPDRTILSTDYNPGANIGDSRKFEVATPSGCCSGEYTILYKIYPEAGDGTVHTETFNINYTFTMPTGSVSLTPTTASSLITSVDLTNYNSSYTNVSTSRVHSLYPPAGATNPMGVALPSPVDSGSSATIRYTGITTGTWTSRVYTLGEWYTGAEIDSTTSTKHYVTGTVGGGGTTSGGVNRGATESSVSINTDLGLCDVYCCLKALNDRYEQAKCKNKDLAEDYKAKIEDVTRLVTLFVQSVSCGLTGDADCYLNDIKNISECGTECSCYDSTSTPSGIPIVSATSSERIKVESSSSRLEVTSSGSGTSADPVVYRMDLGPSVSADISYVAQNVDNVNNRLTSTEKTIKNVLNNISRIAINPERLTMNINHNFTKAGVNIKMTDNFLTGSRFNSVSSNKMVLTSINKNDSNWPSLNNATQIVNLYESKWSETDFYVEARVLNNPNIKVDIFYIDKKSNNGYGAFKYRFINNEGYVLSNKGLSKYRNINISFDLISDKVVK